MNTHTETILGKLNNYYYYRRRLRYLRLRDIIYYYSVPLRYGQDNETFIFVHIVCTVWALLSSSPDACPVDHENEK